MRGNLRSIPGDPSCRKVGRFNALGLKPGTWCWPSMPEAGVIERKTPSDLIACMTSARERFERELAPSRHLGRFVVVVEGGLPDVLAAQADV
jgi:hypothetical protein